jgi:hypothetical protein
MKKTFFLAFVLLYSFPAVAQNTQQKSGQCPITLADVERVFGKGFKEEAPSKLGDILSCRFTNKDFSVHISINPAFGMKIDDYNKMMSPKTVTWKPVPNDPDGARIEIRDEQKDDLATIPAVTYIRNDKYVRLQILGAYYGYDKVKMPKVRDEMRNKLVKLKRVQ